MHPDSQPAGAGGKVIARQCSLPAFVDAVKNIGHRESVRVKTMTWNGMAEVITLKLDTQYWPRYEIHRTNEGWRRVDLGS